MPHRDLADVKNSTQSSQIVMVLCIDLRWLLSGSKPQELGFEEYQKIDAVFPDCHGPIDLRWLLVMMIIT